MWIESLNGFQIQCITEGLQIDKAGLRTKIESQMYKANDFYAKTGMTQASKVAPSTSGALFWKQWSWLGIWGIGVRPDTGYGLASMAKQLNSESVKSRTTISGWEMSAAEQVDAAKNIQKKTTISGRISLV